MSQFNYDPNSMFPKKPKRKSVDKEKVIMWALVVFLVLLISWLSSGCRSASYIEDARIGLTGVDLRFYEPPPVTIIYTNAPVATPSKFKLFPTLMEMNTK